MAPITQHEYQLHKETCGRSFVEILRKLESIDKRLFRDNGTISVQTQIRLNSNSIATMKRLTWIVASSVIVLIVGIVFQRLMGG